MRRWASEERGKWSLNSKSLKCFIALFSNLLRLMIGNENMYSKEFFNLPEFKIISSTRRDGRL